MILKARGPGKFCSSRTAGIKVCKIDKIFGKSAIWWDIAQFFGPCRGLTHPEGCIVTLSGILFILLDFLFCLVYWGLLCFWVTSMFCCYIMKRQKNKHLKFCGWLRMEQSNLFIWRGFFKDFRYVSRLDRQRKRLFEEASLSHGVIKHICVECFCCHCFLFSLELAGWKITFCNFVVRIVFCIACFFVYIEFETGC